MEEKDSPFIYQLICYYGALINGQVAYSVDINFDDCRKLISHPFPEKNLKIELMKHIQEEGFSPSVFEYRWITKTEYENRIDSHVTNTLTVKKEA